MIEELLEEMDAWRSKYLNLQEELGEIVARQQDKILFLRKENRRLTRENWQLRQTKGRR